MSEPDLSEFEKLSKPKSPPCPLCADVEGLSPEDRKNLAAALSTDKGHITNSAISQWLKARGVEISYQVVATHRRLHG